MKFSRPLHQLLFILKEIVLIALELITSIIAVLMFAVGFLAIQVDLILAFAFFLTSMILAIFYLSIIERD